MHLSHIPPINHVQRWSCCIDEWNSIVVTESMVYNRFMINYYSFELTSGSAELKLMRSVWNRCPGVCEQVNLVKGAFGAVCGCLHYTHLLANRWARDNQVCRVCTRPCCCLYCFCMSFSLGFENDACWHRTTYMHNYTKLIALLFSPALISCNQNLTRNITRKRITYGLSHHRIIMTCKKRNRKKANIKFASSWEKASIKFAIEVIVSFPFFCFRFSLFDSTSFSIIEMYR